MLEKRHAGPGGADLPSQLLRRMTQEDCKFKAQLDFRAMVQHQTKIDRYLMYCSGGSNLDHTAAK